MIDIRRFAIPGVVLLTGTFLAGCNDSTPPAPSASDDAMMEESMSPHPSDDAMMEEDKMSEDAMMSDDAMSEEDKMSEEAMMSEDAMMKEDG